MEILVGVLAFLAGSVLTWLLVTRQSSAKLASAQATLDATQRELFGTKQNLDQAAGELRALEKSRAAAEAQLEEAKKNVTDQKNLVEEARRRLTEAFKALAAEALRTNNEGFLSLAAEKFKLLKQEAVGDLDKRKENIEQLVAPIAETLGKYQEQAQKLEKTRTEEIARIGEQLKGVAEAQVTLQSETAKLVNALQTPHVRGAWGGITLRRTAELAGMAKHCDFVEQQTFTGEQARLRPDMIVHLPAGRDIVVDAKVPLAAFLDALNATNDADRDEARTRHAAQLERHVQQLVSKQYDKLTTTAEFVVLFIPNDTFLAAAAEKDAELIERAIGRNVVIATPTTFIALLRAVAYGWRQEQVRENAQRISDLGRELAERVGKLAEHLGSVGKALTAAVEAYNSAVGSFETRVMVSARKFKELGAGDVELEELRRVDQEPRVLGATGE